MYEEVEKVLNEEVSPMLAMHGGGVELVDVSDDGVVKVRLTGGCAGCPMSQMTLASVVEEAIKARVPGIKRVEAV
ncbi:MAG: NifU family protein [bacterium]